MSRKFIAAALIALGLTFVLDRVVIGQTAAELFLITTVWVVAIFWVILDPTAEEG